MRPKPAASVLSPVPGLLMSAGRRVLDLLMPRQCVRCRALVEGQGALCAPCWSEIRFIERPLCRSCGFPFEMDVEDDSLCAACARTPRRVDRCRAAVVYDDASKGIVLALKHGDRTDTVPALADWLVRAGAELIADADLLLPVPLHWTRLFSRRYNQAALLAHAVAARTGVPCVPDAIQRRKRTPILGHLGPKARRETVRAAFAVRGVRGRDRLAGRRVLVIDDVFTTGATTESCAKVLLDAGAAAVDVLAVARVVRPMPA